MQIAVKKVARKRKTLKISFSDSESDGQEELIGEILSSFPEIKPAGYNEFVGPIKYFEGLLDAFDWLDIELYGEHIPDNIIEYVEAKNAIIEKAEQTEISDVPLKTVPFQHQEECFEYAQTHDSFILGDEPGLGKTLSSIKIAVSRKKQFKHCLIVCCVSGLKWNWAQEIHTHSYEKSHVLGSRVNKNGNLVIDSVAKRTEDLIKKHDEFFLITNIETLRDEVFCGALEELTRQGEIGMTVVDEVHKCKNPSSQQGKALLQLQSYYKMALTGTPLMNSPIDLFNILKWIGVEHHTYTQFKNYYCVEDNMGQITGYRHLKDLKKLVADNMLRRKKEEVLDLPAKIKITEYVDMDSRQTKIYNEVKAKLLEDIDRIRLSSNPLAEIIRLRQATGNPSILTTKKIPNAKYKRANELIDEALADGKSVVVFSNFERIITPFFEQLKHPAELVIGEVPEDEKHERIERFKNTDRIKVICGTIGVLGTGFTLTKASVAIFLDSPWTDADKGQAEDRIHRISAVEDVLIYTLVAKGTVDEAIEQIVYSKGELANYVVDGKTNRKFAGRLFDLLLK